MIRLEELREINVYNTVGATSEEWLGTLMGIQEILQIFLNWMVSICF